METSGQTWKRVLRWKQEERQRRSDRILGSSSRSLSGWGGARHLEQRPITCEKWQSSSPGLSQWGLPEANQTPDDTKLFNLSILTLPMQNRWPTWRANRPVRPFGIADSTTESKDRFEQRVRGSDSRTSRREVGKRAGWMTGRKFEAKRPNCGVAA
ncbi:hypothetical protein ASPSYDRAFT_32920 [Aspergillus sydowii CBS 593.65]|uniref:Uncharacterized protein n=1 Tax=Aspergillus sydowii CBS 593.65 TaxID=1036612 RepID=A0A1L9TEE6_9EURO|nr:uncharacterized protein ASPSYDRAFT_32920 [Aspergillus sydowii CBS 593.65]OJJ57786.1 hypothetical protein ASPSYDRAFT_32920 [Aspergillus sydowii CBS 593.65]